MRFLQLIFCVCLLVVPAGARPFSVVVYNVENFFDADGVAVYDDYQPANYTPAHVLTKVTNIARVLAQFEQGKGPDVILLEEIEIDQTPGATAPDYPQILKRFEGVTIEQMLGEKFIPQIADLPAELLLLKACVDRGLTGYTAITGGDLPTKHEDGNARAIKNVIFTRLPVKAVRTHPILQARNILEVQLEVEGHPLYVFNNHWKSGASDAKTELIRVENARVLRARIDELLKADANADILIGGDLNSQYNQKRRYRTMPQTAINDVLGSQGNELAIRGPARDLYNLWFELPPAERGSDTYQGEWGTLMHLIVSRGLYDLRGVQYVDNSFALGRFIGVNADAAGVPIRWNASEGPGGRGFSDHFPLYARFTTTNQNQPGKFIPLTRESAKDNGEVEANRVDFSAIDLAKTAVPADSLNATTNLRDGTWNGRIFRVEGAAQEGNLLKVEFRGEVYEVYGPEKEIRDLLFAQRREGRRLKFYGELGQFKGRWQFVVKSGDWVK